MNFELDEDQTLLRDSVRRYVQNEYEFEQRRELIEAGGFSRAQWQSYAEMGWLAVGLPETAGGYGGLIEAALVAEEFGRGLVLEPWVGCALFAGTLLAEAGCEDAVAALVAGEQLHSVAHEEAAARGRNHWVEARADVTAGGYVLNGTKVRVAAATHADAFLISARTAGAHDSAEGISLLHVPRNTPGLQVRAYPLVDGSVAADVVLDGVAVPASALLGSRGAAAASLDRALALATVLTCAQMLGAMDQALWITRDYLNTRKQFGVLIGSFQALQHRMADMYIAVEQARSIVFRGLAHAADADTARRDAAVSAAKVQAGKCAQFVGAQAIQLHGGVGVTEECSIGHYFKLLLALESAYGNSATHLRRTVAALQAA